MQPLDGRGALSDGIGGVLREIAYRYLVSPLHRAAIDWELPVHLVDVSCRVAHERLQQRGLARTVAPDQRNFFSALDIRREGLDHFQVTVRFCDPLAFEHVASRRRLPVKTDIWPRDT